MQRLKINDYQIIPKNTDMSIPYNQTLKGKNTTKTAQNYSPVMIENFFTYLFKKKER